MSKKEEILVVPKRALLHNAYFNGFCPLSDGNYQRRILDNMMYMQRDKAESNPAFKQPTSYVVLVNDAQEIFAYQRSTKASYKEKRLQGKWSCGLGGHIERHDGRKDPLRDSALREVFEETRRRVKKENLQTLGFINDDSNDVGKVHFGVVHVYDIGRAKLRLLKAEIPSGRFIRPSELERMCISPKHDVESWSRIIIKPLKAYCR